MKKILNKVLSRVSLISVASVGIFVLAGMIASQRSVQAAPLDDFVIIVKTDNVGSTNDYQFEIPTTTVNGEVYNYNVDCNNDGTDEATGQTGNYICDYGSGNAGIYTIRIKDNTGANVGFPRIYFNNAGDRLKLLGINQWGTNKWTSMSGAFYGCSDLNDEGGWATDVPDLSNVTNMSQMLSSAYTFNQDIGSWNTGNVTNMSRMFYAAYAFNQPIGSWNTGNVIDISQMFNFASAFNQPIGSWDTSNVTNMGGTFFFTPAFNQPLESWDTSNVTNMHQMFRSASAFNQPIGSWNTGKVIDMSSMFHYASAFNQSLNSWDTSKTTNMSHMFYDASVFNQPLNLWNTASVTDMSHMFYDTSFFNQNLDSWDTGNVVNMSRMFYFASAFNQDLSGFELDSIVDTGVNTGLRNMLDSSGLSIANYDTTLVGWNGHVNTPSNLTLGADGLNYCNGETARNNLTGVKGWTIDGDSKDCSGIFPAPTTAPDLQAASDLGSSSTDNNTPDNTPTFDVECSVAGNTITLYTNHPNANTQIGTHSCATAGTEQITASTLADGDHNITYTDSNGTESGQSPSLAVTIDTSAPTTPTVTSPTDGSATSDTTPTFTGTGETGAIVNVDDGNGHTCLATVDGSGSWSCDIAPALSDGDTPTFNVTQTDPAGNTSSPAVNISFSVGSIIRADVDQNSTINSTDAMLTLRNSLGLDMSSTNWQASSTTGDVNCDGSSNSTDAMLILRKSLGLDMGNTGWCVD